MPLMWPLGQLQAQLCHLLYSPTCPGTTLRPHPTGLIRASTWLRLSLTCLRPGTSCPSPSSPHGPETHSYVQEWLHPGSICCCVAPEEYMGSSDPAQGPASTQQEDEEAPETATHTLGCFDIWEPEPQGTPSCGSTALWHG